MKKSIFAIVALIFFALVSCKKKDDTEVIPDPVVGKMTFRVDTYANDKTFKLDSAYTTATGSSFTCDMLKFYVSGIKLRKKGTNEFVELKDYYFLYDQAEAEEGARVEHAGNAHLSGIPVGDYDQFSFNIGIPQPRNNDTSSFDGVLSKSNNMYWEWSKEFIFFKFEGKSAQSKTGALLYHVAEDKNLKRIFVDLKATPISVKTDLTQKLRVRFDVDKIFSAISTINFATEYSAMNGTVTTKVGDNYATAFSFSTIE